MITKLKQVVNNPKFWQAGFALLISYMGYGEVSERMTAQNIDVDVHVPETAHDHAHSHTAHQHRDWLPIISAEIEKARRKHSDEYHGGD